MPVESDETCPKTLLFWIVYAGAKRGTHAKAGLEIAHSDWGDIFWNWNWSLHLWCAVKSWRRKFQPVLGIGGYPGLGRCQSGSKSNPKKRSC